ncbi:hypothetical protein [Aurantimonas marina]|nr:hypothetical protein [Aurantimonas marina]
MQDRLAANSPGTALGDRLSQIPMLAEHGWSREALVERELLPA